MATKAKGQSGVKAHQQMGKRLIAAQAEHRKLVRAQQRKVDRVVSDYGTIHTHSHPVFELATQGGKPVERPPEPKVQLDFVREFGKLSSRADALLMKEGEIARNADELSQREQKLDASARKITGASPKQPVVGPIHDTRLIQSAIHERGLKAIRSDAKRHAEWWTDKKKP